MPATPSPNLRTALSLAAAVALVASLLVPGVAMARTDSGATGSPELVLVVVNSTSLADAAVASSLVAAGIGDAVVFAKAADTLAFNDANIIRNREPDRLVLVGGTGALSVALEAELRGLVDGVRVDRLAGVDRVHTAALAAQLVLENISRRPAAPEGVGGPMVVLANAWSKRDVGTAAVAVIAGSADVMLYSHDDSLGSQTTRVLREHRPDRLMVTGTPETFTRAMVTQAQMSAGTAETPTRLDGTTSAQASAQAVRLAAPDDIPIAVISSGHRSQDIGVALALAAALDGSPVLLTNSYGQLGNDAKTLLLEHQPAHVVIVSTEGQYSGEFLMMGLELFASVATVQQLTTFWSTTLLALRGINVPDRSVNRGFSSISAGDNHVCGLRLNGSIACWGVIAGRQTTSPAGKHTAVAAGGEFTCALREDGSPRCWGTTAGWQTGVPDGPFVTITAGWGHACGLTASRSVECWGDRWGAQGLVPSGTAFTAISAGRHHTCGVEPGGTIKCWGTAADGQLEVPEGDFVAVAAGGAHTCGLELTGALKCWGDRTGDSNAFPGEYAARRYLGLDAGSRTTCAVRPTKVVDCWGNDGIQDVPRGFYTSVSAGSTFACALRTNTRVRCWGAFLETVWEPFGNSPLSSPASHLDPGSDSTSSRDFTSISAGDTHLCGLRAGGEIVCWGSDAHGKSTPPTGAFKAVAAGGVITCALRTRGSAECWGSKEDRRNGPGGGPYVDITAGWAHACARPTGGRPTECWGDNWGDKKYVPEFELSEVAAGRHNACGVFVAADRVYCWGIPDAVRLVERDIDVTSISVGERHARGLTPRGAIRCWGESDVLPDVPEQGWFHSVAVGATTTCGARGDRSVDCWGSVAVEDEPPGTFSEVTVGRTFACGLLADANVVCWGDIHSAAWDPFSTSGALHFRD